MIQEVQVQIKQEIDKATHILLHCHPSPDPDSYGSTLAMLHFLEGQGKRVTLIKGDSPIPDFAEFLPGHEKLVLKNYLEIDPTQFDLFVILDSSDPTRVSKLGPVIFPPAMRTVLIDHHPAAEPFANVSFVDTHYAATAEMVASLLLTWQVEIAPDVARCLLVGMYSDTGGFKYQSTTAGTLRVASQLAERAPDYSKVIFDLENNRVPGAIYFQALALSSVKTYFNNQVAITGVSAEELSKHSLNRNDAGGMSIPNILKSVKGWDIGISLVEWESGVTSLSIRTRDADKYDLSILAKSLGGGGHKVAAGAEINKPLAEALTLVLEQLDKNFFSSTV